MKFLWFGKKSFSDVSLKDLEKRKTEWDIRAQKIANFKKQTGDRIDGYKDAATEPGVSKTDQETAGRHIVDLQDKQTRLERHQQLIRKRLDTIKKAIALKEDIKIVDEIKDDGGVLGVDGDFEEVEGEVTSLISDIKEFEADSDTAAATLDYSSRIDTASKDSPEFRSIMAELEKESEKKRAKSEL